VTHVATTAIDLGGNDYANHLIGNYGANYLNGGGGADLLTGLNGNDTYVIDNAGDQVEEQAGFGNDAVLTFVSWTLGVGQEVEVLSTAFQGGTGAIDLNGNNLAQTIYGNNGANVLNGGGGNDTLFGFGGADVFAFTTALGAGNVDVIADMSSGSDRIALDDAIFTALGGLGALNASAFVTGTAAADGDDRIVYNSATGALLYDADGNGAIAAVQFATLQTGLAMTAADFVVI
jgi:Ca2+-binding RTX toxin-like protein